MQTDPDEVMRLMDRWSLRILEDHFKGGLSLISPSGRRGAPGLDDYQVAPDALTALLERGAVVRNPAAVDFAIYDRPIDPSNVDPAQPGGDQTVVDRRIAIRVPEGVRQEMIDRVRRLCYDDMVGQLRAEGIDPETVRIYDADEPGVIVVRAVRRG